MKAGRELDALIAEKVMGWSKEQVETWPVSVPHYSSRIQDAWLVVAKFPQVAIYGPHDLWLVRFSDREGVSINDIDDPGRGDTAPLAICLAALKAGEVT